MKAKRMTKRKKRVVIVTNTINTASTNPNVGDLIWYDYPKDTFVQATLKYLKGWFK